MNKMHLATAFVAALTTPATAFAATAEFSAVTVELRPGQDIATGSLYVGKEATRYEFRQRGLPVVRITFPKQRIIRFLFPIDKSYIEYKIEPGRPFPGTKPTKPCNPNPRVTCALVSAKAKINGMTAERWSIRPTVGPGEVRLWWDPKRKIPLRQEHFDGRVMQATLRGTRIFESQNVEDWEFTYLSPDGRYRRSVSLISPELGVAVVEMLPGGIVRRLHSVTIGAPDAKLFKVPADYKQIKPSQQPAGHLPRAPGNAGQPYRGSISIEAPRGPANSNSGGAKK